MPRLSTDSFVDIVANTTGIVVILTMLSSVLGSKISDEVMAERRRLAEMQQESLRLEDLQAQMPARIQAARAALEAVQSEVQGLEDDWTRRQDQLEDLRRQRSGLEKEIRDLESLAGQGAADLARERADLESRLAAALQDLPAELAAEVRAGDLAQMRAATAQAEAAAARLRQEVDEAVRREQDLRRQAAAAAAANDALETAVQALEAARRPLVLARSPHAHRPEGSRPYFVECLQEAGQPAVRLVTSASYARESEGLRPLQPGDPLAALPAGAGVWGGLALDPVAGRPGGHLYAVVRPEGFAAFRALREWAATKGWWVEWDPLPEGAMLPHRAKAAETGGAK